MDFSPFSSSCLPPPCSPIPWPSLGPGPLVAPWGPWRRRAASTSSSARVRQRTPSQGAGIAPLLHLKFCLSKTPSRELTWLWWLSQRECTTHCRSMSLGMRVAFKRRLHIKFVKRFGILFGPNIVRLCEAKSLGKYFA